MYQFFTTHFYFYNLVKVNYKQVTCIPLYKVICICIYLSLYNDICIYNLTKHGGTESAHTSAKIVIGM